MKLTVENLVEVFEGQGPGVRVSKYGESTYSAKLTGSSTFHYGSSLFDVLSKLVTTNRERYNIPLFDHEKPEERLIIDEIAANALRYRGMTSGIPKPFHVGGFVSTPPKETDTRSGREKAYDAIVEAKEAETDDYWIEAVSEYWD